MLTVIWSVKNIFIKFELKKYEFFLNDNYIDRLNF